MVKELESARAEVGSLKVELDCARAYSQDTTVTRDQMVAARDQLAFELDAERQRTTGLQAELREAESVMQELIEDKKKISREFGTSANYGTAQCYQIRKICWRLKNK